MKIDLSQNVCHDKYLNYNLDPFKYGKHSVCLDILQDHYSQRVEIGYGISELFERINQFLVYKNYKLRCAYNSWLGAEKYSQPKGNTFYIANPNGIDGSYKTKEEIFTLAEQYDFIIVDEAYADFSHHSIIDDIPPNAIVLKTLSKSLALPGARVGWVMGNTECLDFLELVRPRTSCVGGINEQLKNMLNEIPYHVERMLETKYYIEKKFETVPSAGNYVLFIHPPPELLSYYIMKEQESTYRMALINLDHFKNASFT
jgi:hypothetical protein